MTPPLRRGTASRLGLRTPYSRPQDVRLRPVTSAAVAEVMRRWAEEEAAAVRRARATPTRRLPATLAVDVHLCRERWPSAVHEGPHTCVLDRGHGGMHRCSCAGSFVLEENV